MLDLKTKPSLDFPDDPMKWDGWSKYRSDNPYERLCLDPEAQPGDEEILQNCAALLQWWQRKLRLKNQPSNPIAQLLGRGIDEASRYLIQARMELLDPVRRIEIDEELAAGAHQRALAEFAKYVGIFIAGRILTAETEQNLVEFGQRNGLTEEETRACIEEELQRNDARRAVPAEPAAPEAEEEYHRILRLSKLCLGDATPLVREIFTTVAENLGISIERAEQLLENYLDEEERESLAPTGSFRAPFQPANSVPVADAKTPPRASAPAATKTSTSAPGAAKIPSPPAAAPTVVVKPAKTRAGAKFKNPSGSQMVLIPGGQFVMGSDAPDALPDEQPLTLLTLNDFYMSRHPVTNAQYERFDPSHKQKRIKGAGDDHPVVYVTSLDAINFCEWLGQKDGETYRLPTEAEWEYAARGNDRRKYPWGSHDRRGGFANFADASTTFAWRDPQVNDGYPETSPVGAFPAGASFFGLEDMAGNVWEWCSDFYQPLGIPTDRKGLRPVPSGKRVYRGGSWKSRFTNLRATARSSNAPNYSCNDVGFRVVCDCSAA
ncbi:MAG TPA: SUMF1/EgtB/PvdO family nonheme iron enzyme [Chthoniobacterales bacterium]|nr:SUMF1/EgtB/PvdO family nonheme iron enzyme [Chthoniobacterales bacterium]